MSLDGIFRSSRDMRSLSGRALLECFRALSPANRRKVCCFISELYEFQRRQENITLQFNGSRLKAVRGHCGYELPALSQLCSIPASELDAMEQGSLEPSRLQLTALSDVFSVLPAFFYFSS